MAEITLSEGLNTREDAEKIARGLWAEAVRRGWEGEYRDIIEMTEGGEHIPSVGSLSCALVVTRNLADCGTTGAALAPIVSEFSAQAIQVGFEHKMDTTGENSECCCPTEDGDPNSIRSKVAAHAREVLDQKGSWLAVRFAPLPDGQPRHYAECSSSQCRNA